MGYCLVSVYIQKTTRKSPFPNICCSTCLFFGTTLYEKDLQLFSIVPKNYTIRRHCRMRILICV